jgi:hypothetical protein
MIDFNKKAKDILLILLGIAGKTETEYLANKLEIMYKKGSLDATRQAQDILNNKEESR